MEDLRTASVLFAKGNADDDSIEGADSNDGDETIYGGAGNDTVFNDAGTGQRNCYGDKGDDSITLVSDEASLAKGGIGADTITVNTEVANADKAFHSIDGGAGIDVITLQSAQSANQAGDYAIDAEATKTLLFEFFAEFLDQGDVVDSINMVNDDAALAVISGALTITDSDEFDRIVHDTTTNRTDGQEKLVISTSSTTTAGSSVVLDDAASLTLAGIDLSAGTAGDSLIDNSADTTGAVAMLLKGGLGRNTIKGGSGDDVIIGDDKNNDSSWGTLELTESQQEVVRIPFLEVLVTTPSL